MTQTELTTWQLINDKNAIMCVDCNQSIWYENTKAKLRFRGKNKGMPYYGGTSYQSHKIIENKKYSVQRCSVCLSNELPSYQTVNKSKIFNTLNVYVSFAFNIPLNLINTVNKKRVPTLKNLILKYGKENGTLKWNEYRRKQAESNSFEYKKAKLGWDKKTFDNFNKSRAVTLENLIKKHGKIEGRKKWDSYVELQKITKSKNYVVDKYGLEYWLSLCKSKTNTINNFISRHGKTNGILKFESYIEKLKKNLLYSSKIANEFFNILINSDNIFGELSVYYSDNSNGEYGKYCDSVKKYYFLDFYIKELNLGVEFNGDYFHANPDIYEDLYSDFWYTDLTAKEIRINDDIKINALNKDHKITVITVWESEYKKDPEKTINELVNIIKKIYNEKLSV